MPSPPEYVDDSAHDDTALHQVKLVADDSDAQQRAEMEAAEMTVRGTPAAIEFTRCIYRLLNLPLDLVVLQQPVKLWPYLDDCGRPDGYHFHCGRNVNGLLCYSKRWLILLRPGGGRIDPARYQQHYPVVLEHLQRLGLDPGHP